MILLKLKQRVCEWRSEIAKRALLAVEHFFSDYEELATEEARAAYIEWAVPKNEYRIDKMGVRVIVPPTIYPYMWMQVIETESGSSVSVHFLGMMRCGCVYET